MASNIVSVTNVALAQNIDDSVQPSVVETDTTYSRDVGMNWPSFVTEEEKIELLQLYEETFGAQSPTSTRAINYTYNECFGTVEWITRSGSVSLSIMPKSPLYTQTMPNAAMAVANYAWGLLADKYSSDPQWDNEESMFAQFHCHVLAAGKYKTPWNIEPWRTETNIAVVISKACNP